MIPKIKNIYLFLAILLLANITSNSQESFRNVVFESIYVNGKKIQDFTSSNLILAKTDTLSIFYELKINNAPKTPFLFKIKLENNGDSAVKAINQSNLQYVYLPEGEYRFSLSAFDLQKTWRTEEISFVFNVNNKMKQLIIDNELLKKQINEKKPDSTATNIDMVTVAGMNLELRSLIIGAFIVLLISGVIILFIYKKLLMANQQLRTGKFKPDTQAKTSEFEPKEVQNLKKELEQLRGQIDAMQSRASEMSKQNRELEDKVSKLTQTKEDLESLQVQKDELFAIIIHDIKNPVGIIKNLVELLRSYDLTVTEQQEIMDDIILTTSKIVSLSHEVSRILALEGGKMRLDLKSYSVKNLAEDVFNRNKIKADMKGIECILDIADDLPDFQVDEQKIYEVIDNLLSNAIKFTHNGGLVRLKAQKIDDAIVIEVSDNGLGLSEEDIQHAFQRGSQLSAKPTAGESSTGLGLWIVKKLVEAHKGRVWVRSTIGKGATFAFSVPITAITDVSYVDMSAK